MNKDQVISEVINLLQATLGDIKPGKADQIVSSCIVLLKQAKGLTN